MISEKMIKDGIRKGTVKLITDPSVKHGTVCRIGTSWFYFGGPTAWKLDPEDYRKAVPEDDIVRNIYSTLQGFLEGESLRDEYAFYEAMLRTAGDTAGSTWLVFLDAGYIRDAQAFTGKGDYTGDPEADEDGWQDISGPVLCAVLHKATEADARKKAQEMYPDAPEEVFLVVSTRQMEEGYPV